MGNLCESEYGWNPDMENKIIEKVRPVPNDAEELGGGTNKINVSRREFMQTLGVTAAVTASGSVVSQGKKVNASTEDDARPIIPPSVGPGEISYILDINNKTVQVRADSASTLAEVLRWNLQLTGTKTACDRGACGSCSVLIDGRLISACMMLGVDAVGTQIETIEGIATKNGHGQSLTLHPIQEAFVKHDAMQCGFCTPGLVLAAKSLLDTNPKPTLDEIKEGLSGNLCRCGTYSNVYNAVLDAAGFVVPDETVKIGGGS